MKKLYPLLIALCAVILSSCHSKKALINTESARTRGSGTFDHKEPRILIKPDDDIASKYAAIMNVNKSDILDGKLYEFIDEWMGTPYKFGGLDKSGIDCSGLAYLIHQQVFENNLPRVTSLQVNAIKRKYENELKEGDLVFFDFDGKPFSHVGIYLQNGYVVHASSRKGVIIVKLHDPSLYKYFSRAGTFENESDSGYTAGSN